MKKVAILLSTFNGEKFILEQLESLRKQKNVIIKLFLIDDNSTDNTLNIIKKFNIPKKIFNSQNFRNPVKNFMFLLNKVPSTFDYYCFCDQDDFWFPNKINDSIRILNTHKGDVVGSRTIYVDTKLNYLGKSLKFKKLPSLNNALVQSIAGGNTLLWNKKFQKILKKIGFCIPASHDWYIYQVSQVLKLKFIYYDKPLLLYRQHGNNVIGSNTGIWNLIKRINWGLKGRYKSWHNKNKPHLNQICKIFGCDQEIKNKINFFYYGRKSRNIFTKIYYIFFKSRARRQTILGNFTLLLATLLNKV